MRTSSVAMWGRRFRLPALALLFPFIASAQLALVTFDGTAETPVASVYDYGKVATGGAKDVRFRARNTGNSAVVLTTLTVSGTGFSITGAPTPPSTIAPANFLEFTVHFSAGTLGSYSANLQVNSISALLLATSVAAPTLTVLPGCTGPNPVNFGLVQRATLRICSFSLQNPNSQPLVISTLTVTGAAFKAPQGVNTPFTLPAGQAVTFNISFIPPASITYAGTLTIETQTFSLTGGGFDPPLPKPTLQFDAGTMGSAQQRTLTMLLPTASPVTVSGLVTLTFQPGTSIVTDDPAVVFMASGSRKVAFAVKQGDTQISLGGQTGAVFQTGTTAGTLTFTVTGTPMDGDPTTTVSIPPAIIPIDLTTASKRVNDLDIEVIGYDNTYTAGAMSFTFFDTKGNTLGAGAIGADFTSNFRSYFTSVLSGSSFVMRVTFPVTGDAATVGSVQVDLINSAGVAHTGRVQFQ
jgi:hypothetical protein